MPDNAPVRRPGPARKARWFWLVLATLVLSDCSTKELAESSFGADAGPHPVLGEWVRLTLEYNPGAAMSLSFGGASRIVTAALASALAATSVPEPGAAQAGTGRLSRCGVVRAQAVVDSVFIDRTSTSGTIEGGDWASYLMARLGVSPLPDTSSILVAVDSEHIAFSGRIQDLPAEARAMLGALAALVDSGTVLVADVVLLPANKGLAHFRLRGVTVGAFPVPEVVLHSMLLDVGERYPALTRSGRDLYVQIPPDGRVMLVPGAVKLAAPRLSPATAPPGGADPPPPSRSGASCAP
ncbi:MAG TPA: hypothetical protein VGQ17_13735 [Gemmatimonadales bacterium]|nr:hypothetical protein [Gemmatimonadales bacterium]